MTSASLPTGSFICNLEFRRIRPPAPVREERQGVTYLVARDYEIAYDTTLYFANGAQLPIKARLVGELNESIVIRDPGGRPLRRSGYVQGLTELMTSDGHVIFRGRYYDSRTLQSLAGDDALTPVGATLVDHCENGFGEGPYAGHAFSLGAHLMREGEGPLRGSGRGQID
jgi:hypothetical protein